MIGYEDLVAMELARSVLVGCLHVNSIWQQCAHSNYLVWTNQPRLDKIVWLLTEVRFNLFDVAGELAVMFLLISLSSAFEESVWYRWVCVCVCVYVCVLWVCVVGVWCVRGIHGYFVSRI